MLNGGVTELLICLVEGVKELLMLSGGGYGVAHMLNGGLRSCSYA